MKIQTNKRKAIGIVLVLCVLALLIAAPQVYYFEAYKKQIRSAEKVIIYGDGMGLNDEEFLNVELNPEQAEAVKDFFCKAYWGVMASDCDCAGTMVFQFDELGILADLQDEAALKMLLQEDHFDPGRLRIRVKRGWITIT